MEETRNLTFSPYPGQAGMEANEPDGEELYTQLGTLVHGEEVDIVDGNSCTMVRRAGLIRRPLDDASRGMSDSTNEAT